MSNYFHAKMLANPQFQADLAGGLSSRKMANKWGVGRTFVLNHRSQPQPDFDTPTQPNLRASTSQQSSDGSRTLEAIRDRPVTLTDAREWIAASGDNPDDFEISIRSIAYGVDMFSNRMSATPKKGLKHPVEVLDVDPIELLKQLRSTPTMAVAKRGGESAFVLSINDTQFGKVEGGGTPATIARVEKYVRMARERILHLTENHSIGTLVILGGGDIVEGCTIYPNQSYSLDLDRRSQINTAVAMILHVIDSLAPMFEKVIVLAARGNHGENRINGNRTTLHDNDDTLVFEIAQTATKRDPQLQHVQYIIADDEAGVWVDVAGWRLATTHGDVYGKGVAGASIDKKAQNWYKNMAMGRDDLGRADVLITHHYHHDKMSDWGACLWRQTPALDGGSEYFRQSTGEFSKPGMLTFVMSPERRYFAEEVLR